MRRVPYERREAAIIVGSALDWGSRGREFKSRHSDHPRKTKKIFGQKNRVTTRFFASQKPGFEKSKT